MDLNFSLTNPFGWWLVLFAIPIVILHLRKVRLRRQSVSTLIFWNQVIAERRAGTLGRQLRQVLSLFLSLLFLSLLVGAVLDPVLMRHHQSALPKDNVAITRLQPRRSFADPLEYEVLIESVNHSDTPRECQVELTLDGQLVDSQPLVLAAHSTQTQILHGSTAQGGVLKASLDTSDAFAGDNTASAVLPEADRLKIALYGTDDYFLTKILQSQQNVELLTGEEFSQTDEMIRIYHQTVPHRIPAGNVFIIDPQNDCDLFTVGDLIESPLVGQTSRNSPLTRFVQWNNVLIPGARAIRFTASMQKPEILAATPEGNPIFFQWNNGEKGKITVLTADLKRSDLALRTAFPILVSNILDSFHDQAAPEEFSDLPEDASPKNTSGLPIWFLLTLFALLLSVLDWFLYHRRWI